MATRERLICASSDLADGGDGVRFAVEIGDVTQAAFAIRYRGAVYAYYNRCGHVPMELDWQHGRFFDSSGLYLICGTHGALYAPESGACVLGRCNGKGLHRLDVVEREDGIYLIESD